jgi:hypothetical protein
MRQAAPTTVPQRYRQAIWELVNSLEVDYTYM